MTMMTTTMTTKRKLKRCIKSAARAGCPRDQTDRFINSGYIPLPWQWKFHSAAREADNEDGPVDIGLGGARGPGKSHASLSQVALDDCQRVPGLKVLFLRQTGLASQESFDDLVSKVVQGHVRYKKTLNGIRFENGSRIRFGGFKTEKDIDKYVGIEYDVIIVEELTQLTESKYEKLRGSLRTSKPNWRPRMYTTFNPGGIGHGFVKNRYVVPFKKGEETDTRFIPSTYDQNPYTNKEYKNYLVGLKGDLGKAWREGEWDIFAGQYFAELRDSIHGYDSFEIPRQWSRFLCVDYGYDHPACCYWVAIDNDGQLWFYKEYVCRGKTYTQFAEKILEMCEPGEIDLIEYMVADPAIWAKKGGADGLSGAEEMQNVFGHQIILTPANNDRIIGWGIFREWLRVVERVVEGKKIRYTRMHVSRALTFWWEKVPELQHNPKRPEDVLKNTVIAADGTVGYADDPADATRYGLMSRPQAPTPKKKIATVDRYGQPKRKAPLQNMSPSYKRPEWNPPEQPKSNVYTPRNR